MTLDKSALTDLLHALRAGGDLDLLREAMQLVLQALIEAEASDKLGAGIRAKRHPHHPPQRRASPPVIHQGR